MQMTEYWRPSQRLLQQPAERPELKRPSPLPRCLSVQLVDREESEHPSPLLCCSLLQSVEKEQWEHSTLRLPCLHLEPTVRMGLEHPSLSLGRSLNWWPLEPVAQVYSKRPIRCQLVRWNGRLVEAGHLQARRCRHGRRHDSAKDSH